MVRFARWAEILLGAFFLVSAGAKAVDMDGFGALVSAYNVVKDPALVRASSYLALIAEVLLGSALVAGWRFKGLTHFLTAGMTVVYSGLIAYAWKFHGLEDCGCLPGLVKLGPPETLIKNVVLLSLLAFAWYGTRQVSAETEGPGKKLRKPAPLLAIASIVLIAIFAAIDVATRGGDTSALQTTGVADADRPFAQFVFSSSGKEYDLGEGEYLVAMLSATCEHCQASVSGLNALVTSGQFPDFVALMIGTDEEVDDFLVLTEPEFPLQPIEMLTFMSFIGTAPPRLIYVRDGQSVQIWDWDGAPPSVDNVAASVTSVAPATD
ncbi:MAG: hypothetical protein IID09_06290 [Candidatus Hydrogenedentes bacterium]|nr:hypothetical protein [Candidatus Hydrogenedentota bacterium]